MPNSWAAALLNFGEYYGSNEPCAGTILSDHDVSVLHPGTFGPLLGPDGFSELFETADSMTMGTEQLVEPDTIELESGDELMTNHSYSVTAIRHGVDNWFVDLRGPDAGQELVLTWDEFVTHGNSVEVATP